MPMVSEKNIGKIWVLKSTDKSRQVGKDRGEINEKVVNLEFSHTPQHYNTQVNIGHYSPSSKSLKAQMSTLRKPSLKSSPI